MKRRHLVPVLTLVPLSWLVLACGGKADRPPVVTAQPPATTTIPQQMARNTPERPERDDTMDRRGDDLIPMEGSDPLGIRELDLDAVNDLQPLADVHFDFDSAALLTDARATLEDHADILKSYPSMTILIEGHCDERGTVEYNLALGERRASSVYNYLLSLGIDASRLKTISYGKEFPLDPGHNEAAWSRNRRAHFEITAK